MRSKSLRAGVYPLAEGDNCASPHLSDRFTMVAMCSVPADQMIRHEFDYVGPVTSSPSSLVTWVAVVISVRSLSGGGRM